MKDKKLKLINSFIISAIVVIVFITSITIFSELNKEFKKWLKEAFTHHWIGKGILSSFLFVFLGFIVYFLPLRLNEKGVNKRLRFLIYITAISVLTVIMFFIYETFR
jgi:predicted Co/Zn/Cd cation transporter (cation efflux family)